MVTRTGEFSRAEHVTPPLRFWQRLANRSALALLRLANVSAVLPGYPEDGLTRYASTYDTAWPALAEQLADTRSAWRTNPLARRIVGLITSYVVGDGLTLHAEDPDLSAFLIDFAEANRLPLRIPEWCDELTRSGELFITLHLNHADGMSYIRALPAADIDAILTDPEDYETELTYHQLVPVSDPTYPAGRTWYAPHHPQADIADADGYRAVMLHFAINRPIGAVRGESDLAPVAPWLRRYNRWLEDRVRLNAAVRAFMWVIKVPGRLVEAKKAEYALPPEPGQVLVLDRDNEEWQAVAPALHANDAAPDGRAVRWMIAAGGPGIGLVDLGEAEDANLATAKAMAEQRARFMRARQNYFADVLTTIALTAYNRRARLFTHTPELTARAVTIIPPDVTPDDNAALAQSAHALAQALQTVSATGIAGPTWQRTVVQLVLKFAGELLDEKDLNRILKESATQKPAPRLQPASQPVGAGSPRPPTTPEGDPAP